MRILLATFVTAATLAIGCTSDEEEVLEDTAIEECDTAETTLPEETTDPVEPVDTGDTGDTTGGEV